MSPHSSTRFVDLSHTVYNGLITYKGLPAPVVCDYLSREASTTFYENGTSFQIGKIEMVGNTGTYLDSPFHRYEDGKELSDLELNNLVNIPAITIHASDTKAIGIQFFKNKDLKNKAVLVRTDWSKHWNTDTYFENHPFLTGEAAQYLKENQVKLVGIDSHNIDDTSVRSRPVHSILLAADVLIVEHLCCLELLPDHDYLFTAAPPKIKSMGTFPVRAYATVFN